jgi:ABC-type glutathione transport system ATPase component
MRCRVSSSVMGANTVERAEPLLSVEGLRIGFPSVEGERVAVDDLSFTVRRGEVLAIIGESGSGKSVTAKSIMRLERFLGGRVLAGRIILDEGENRSTDLILASEAKLRSLRGGVISMVFQEPMTSLNSVLTIGRQLAETLILHQRLSPRQAEVRSVELLRQVQIQEPERRFKQYPHELSGGMRQRVMIAMALACRPALLIADEPTTALDVTIQAEILALLKALQSELGLTILFITHDMGVVASIADRVLVMQHGRKVEEGRVAEVFAAPSHPYTKLLLSAVPKLGAMRGKSGPERFALAPNETDAAATSSPSAMAAARGPAGPVVLEVRDLTVRFAIRQGLLKRTVAHVHAVERVSFTLGARETLALVGESGSGKSTIGRALLRLVEPTCGEIRLKDRSILTLAPAQMRNLRRDIQMVFQDPFASLNPRMTIEEIVAEPFHIHTNLSASNCRENVADLLRRVGLGPDDMWRFPFEFSGGQRQRICIARALALGPSVIVADEAVSALDASIRAQMVNLLMDLQDELGLSYLFISHDMAVVERVSHRVAVMYLGEIVEIGPRDAVMSNPQHPYTQRLIAAVPSGIPGRMPVPGILGKPESTVKPIGYRPPVVSFEEVTSGHFVLRSAN